MIAALIRWSVANRFFVLLGALALIVAGGLSVRSTSIDALPDLSDTQVIIRTSYPGQAPQLVENQVAYPLATTMLFRRQQFHQDRLSATANMGRQAFVDHIQTHGGFNTLTLARFYHAMQSQALMLSFMDVFKVFGFGCVLVIIMVLMLKKTRLGKAPVGMH